MPSFTPSTESYKSADLTNLLAGNIKSGVTIAGQVGDYPSSSHPLPGADNTTDLDAQTCDAKVKSASMFDYWNSNGVRQTGSGDPDVSAENIKNSVSIFGISGTYTGQSPSAWDLRAGVTVGNVTGKLKVNCRNRANSSIFDIDQGQAATITTGLPGIINIPSHGLSNGTIVKINFQTPGTGGLSNALLYYVVNAAADAFQVANTLGGAGIQFFTAGPNVTVHKWQPTPQAIDIWDTIEDKNNDIVGLPPNIVAGWSSDTDCGGVESTPDDDQVWKDVTTTALGVASSCTADSVNCTIQDKITGLWWSKTLSSVAWWQAVSNCQNLNHNGQTGWRLPTQKELLDAYNHGIRSAASTNWLLPNYLWSASTQSNSKGQAWKINIRDGASTTENKWSNLPVSCVRP